MAGFRNHICQKSVYSVVVEGSEIYTHFNTVLSYVTEEGLLTYTAGLDACIPIRGMSTSYPSPAPSNAELGESHSGSSNWVSATHVGSLD